MKVRSFSWLNLLVFVSLLKDFIGAEEPTGFQITFINEMNVDTTVYWEGENERHLQGEIHSKGGELMITTDYGHIFSYDHGEERHFIRVPPAEENGAESFSPVFILNGGKDEVDVFCTTSIDAGSVKNVPLRIILRPSWAPRAVSRFMQLVRAKYYDGVAITRVVPRFLTQFGIGKHLGQRFTYSEIKIEDDLDLGIKFQPGMISFAGNGINSRTTEVFIVMPGTPEDQLNYFGRNPWETPFGYVSGNLEDTPLNYFASNGDMPPTGEGPDPHKVFASDGYEYLEKEFPNMDYINNCFLPWERDAVDTSEEL